MFSACTTFLLLVAASATEPVHLRMDEIVKNICNYDMRAEPPLESIKIMKGGNELYKYVSPDNSLSDEQNELVLELADFNENYFDLHLGGMYRCKVNTIIKKNSESTNESQSDINVELTATPQDPSVDEIVTLSCNYSLGAAPLYIVKYYKGVQEFFRYTPNELPEKKIFPTRNLQYIDGGAYHVNFRTIGLQSAGRYTCEVTTDTPLLTTKSASIDVTIEKQSGPVNLLTNIPNPVLDEHLELSCVYNIEPHRLHSLNIYKGDSEFFRFVPSSSPSVTFFPIQYLESSWGGNETTVQIIPTDLKASGIYRCEVNTEGPSFLTFTSEKTITIQNTTNDN